MRDGGVPPTEQQANLPSQMGGHVVSARYTEDYLHMAVTNAIGEVFAACS